jgi:predicted O-linked N-acetylglucosamine transferase (SPINDLY family)
VDAHNNLGKVLRDQGKLDEAIEVYRRLVDMRPDRPELHSNLLYTLHYDPKTDPAALRGEYERFAQRHARPLYAQIRPHANNRDPDRRLRIGYVSAYLRSNIISNVIAALLTHHDCQQFEIVCYADPRRHESGGQRLMDHVDLWRDMTALDDQQLAEQIRADEIDILVDLAVHSANHRLLAFARKPAPVQVTYLGYNAPTGLATIDYRLTDRYMESGSGFRVPGPGAEFPEPGTRNPEPERPFPLPDCYWCYTTPAEAIEVNDLPALANGYVTFASFNNFVKVNAQVIALWCQILQATPSSRITLSISGGQRNVHVWRAFEQHGVARERVKLLELVPYAEYWPLHHQVDLALDPFPYNGGVTSLDGLYMGIPLVTLAGDRPLARAGVSILSNLDLPELIAQTPQDYVRIASDLAKDVNRLRELRRTLRPQMSTSVLMDGARFAKAVETAYRQMWRNCCAG